MCTCGGMHVALLHVLRAVLPFLCIHIIFPCDRFPRSIFWAAAFFRIASQFRNHQARKRWGRWVPEGATVKRGAMHVVKPKRGQSAPPALALHVGDALVTLLRPALKSPLAAAQNCIPWGVVHHSSPLRLFLRILSGKKKDYRMTQRCHQLLDVLLTLLTTTILPVRQTFVKNE